MTGEGNIEELRLLPDADLPDGEALAPRALRRFAPQSDLYVALGRAALKMEGEDARGAADALRAVGRPGRGLPDEFFRTVATEYLALVAEGEPHPIKTLGLRHVVDISVASRWVKEARHRGLIKPKGGTDGQ